MDDSGAKIFAGVQEFVAWLGSSCRKISMMENSAENTKDFCSICDANGTQIVIIFMMECDFFFAFHLRRIRNKRLRDCLGQKLPRLCSDSDYIFFRYLLYAAEVYKNTSVSRHRESVWQKHRSF